MSVVIQYILYLAILIVLAIPLWSIYQESNERRENFSSKILTPCENAVYKVMRVKKTNK